MKYQKKAVIIDAVQFNKQNEPFPEEFEKAICREHHFGMIEPARPHIHTLEGNHYIQENDWIIKGVNGEFYPCKPDIFEKTYEIIEQTDSEYYTEKEVSDMDIISDNFREYLYGWNDAFIQGKGYLKKYVDMYLTHTH